MRIPLSSCPKPPIEFWAFAYQLKAPDFIRTINIVKALSVRKDGSELKTIDLGHTARRLCGVAFLVLGNVSASHSAESQRGVGIQREL